MNRTYLVTGGLGFIASHFIKLLLKKEPESFVINIDKETYAGNPKNLDGISEENCLTIEADILDAALIRSVLEVHRPDYIIHFAAETHVDNSITDPLGFVKTNVLGTATLLNESLTYYKAHPDCFQGFIHISTDEVYGALTPQDSHIFDEQTRYDPHSPYSASKAGSDHLVQSYHDTYGLPTIITHSSNNYGSHQHPEKLIPKVINNLYNGKMIPVYGDGRQMRDWIHVENNCETIYNIMLNGSIGETYCIGGECDIENIQIINKICDIFDDRYTGTHHADLIDFVPDRLGHDFRYAIDISKIKREILCAPLKSLDKGLIETVEWYCENQDWVKEMKERK